MLVLQKNTKHAFEMGNKQAEKEGWQAYRTLKQTLEDTQARLEEFCGAVEDFGLACEANVVQDQRLIYCKTGAYTPCELLRQAQQAANQLEALTEQVQAARGRILSEILYHSKNLSEYRENRWKYIDSVEQESFAKLEQRR